MVGCIVGGLFALVFLGMLISSDGGGRKIRHKK